MSTITKNRMFVAGLPKWDGKHRIELFTRDVLGYHPKKNDAEKGMRLWGYLWRTSTQEHFDTNDVPVFYGVQGIGKTWLANNLALNSNDTMEIDDVFRDQKFVEYMIKKYMNLRVVICTANIPRKLISESEVLCNANLLEVRKPVPKNTFKENFAQYWAEAKDMFYKA